MPFQTVGRSAALEISFKASTLGRYVGRPKRPRAFIARSLIFGSSARAHPEKSPGSRFIACARERASPPHLCVYLLISESLDLSGVNEPSPSSEPERQLTDVTYSVFVPRLAITRAIIHDC